jgi:phosphoesterase RecJ-like protein
MPGAEKALIYDYIPDKCKEIFKKGTLVFAVDFNDLSRICEFEEHLVPTESYKVLIDHHPNPGEFADLTISDTSVSSTCELVYMFIKSLEIDGLIDQNVAECIYAGIMTDTGCFSFNSSKRQTFDVVAELIELGIQKDMIYDRIYDNYSFERMKLFGHCLHEKMVVLPEYKAAYISLSSEDMKKYNFKVGDSEGFVNVPLSIKGIVFSVLFTEKEDIVKVSLRSKGKFAVNEIASEHYNGGGHVNASGGESKKNLQDTIKNFVSLLPNYKDKLLNE